jgi:hypothetical protein
MLQKVFYKLNQNRILLFSIFLVTLFFFYQIENILNKKIITEIKRAIGGKKAILTLFTL